MERLVRDVPDGGRGPERYASRRNSTWTNTVETFLGMGRTETWQARPMNAEQAAVERPQRVTVKNNGQ